MTILFFILMIGAFIIGVLMSDIPNGKNIGEFLGKILVSIIFLIILWRFHWFKESGITNPGSLKNWLIIIIPLAYAVLSTTYAYTGIIDLSIS